MDSRKAFDLGTINCHYKCLETHLYILDQGRTSAVPGRPAAIHLDTGEVHTLLLRNHTVTNKKKIDILMLRKHMPTVYCLCCRGLLLSSFIVIPERISVNKRFNIQIMVLIMVFRLDGCSFYYAHIRSKSGILIN